MKSFLYMLISCLIVFGCDRGSLDSDHIDWGKVEESGKAVLNRHNFTLMKEGENRLLAGSIYSIGDGSYGTTLMLKEPAELKINGKKARHHLVGEGPITKDTRKIPLLALDSYHPFFMSYGSFYQLEGSSPAGSSIVFDFVTPNGQWVLDRLFVIAAKLDLPSTISARSKIELKSLKAIGEQDEIMLIVDLTQESEDRPTKRFNLNLKRSNPVIYINANDLEGFKDGKVQVEAHIQARTNLETEGVTRGWADQIFVFKPRTLKLIK